MQAPGLLLNLLFVRRKNTRAHRMHVLFARNWGEISIFNGPHLNHCALIPSGQTVSTQAPRPWSHCSLRARGGSRLRMDDEPSSHAWSSMKHQSAIRDDQFIFTDKQPEQNPGWCHSLLTIARVGRSGPLKELGYLSMTMLPSFLSGITSVSQTFEKNKSWEKSQSDVSQRSTMLFCGRMQKSSPEACRVLG